MTAIEALLSELIDYAGLYPPAVLDMDTAVRNYLRYRLGPRANLLGRFVVNLDRIDELRAAAGDSLPTMRLSVIVPAGADLERVAELMDVGKAEATYEFKFNRAEEIERIESYFNRPSDCYVEVPVGMGCGAFLDPLKTVSARAKLRMGGITPEAIPAAKAVALVLAALAERRLSFKATAGLHHPIRSRHFLTYAPGSPVGTMHGFLNLACAAILLHFGGAADDATEVLEEQDPGVWRISPNDIGCRGLLWSTDQIRRMRKEFFISFGSWSFEEPIEDLEALGWL